MKEQPFNLTPSPRFLYLGEIHREALAVLTYGVVERKGFILLTGETGTGKSTMVQALLDNLDDSVQYVYFPNPLLSAKDLMTYLAYSAFRKKVNLKSKAEFLIAFECFLKQRSLDDKNFVVIIDEAQELSLELLEEVRLLSNVGTAQKNLVNIFLVGQPELNKKLTHSRCRPLLQRISIRYHMSPLDLQGTQEYMDGALKMAGAKDGQKIFPKSVVKAIYEHSEGYPRMINILADNLLLLGYSRGVKKITPSMVKECHNDLHPDNNAVKILSQRRQSPERSKPSPRQTRVYWMTAAALILMMVLLALAVIPNGRDAFWRLTGLLPDRLQPADNRVAQEQTSAQKRIIKEIRDVSNDNSAGRQDISGGDMANAKPAETDTIISMEPRKPEGSVSEENKLAQKRLVVRKGDTFSGLATAVYGRAEEDILKLVHKYNPHINNMDYIEVGQEIVFPPLPPSSNN